MIYLLEDDDSIRKLVLYGLDSQGFQAKGFALPSEFWRAMDAELPELVLLDIMLPEEDGLSILKKLRNTPSLRTHSACGFQKIQDSAVYIDGSADSRSVTLLFEYPKNISNFGK